MKREIKFRMWRDGRMQQLHDMGTSADYDFDFNKAEVEGGEGGIILQFTGLKLGDREIYDGDIVENIGDYEDPTLRYVIEWRQDYYGYVAVGGLGEVLSLEEMEEAIYVGNIYENPELNKPV